MAEKIIEDLYTAIKKAGVSTAVISKELGVSRQALNYRKRKTRQPTLSKLIELQLVAKKFAGVDFELPNFTKTKPRSNARRLEAVPDFDNHAESAQDEAHQNAPKP